MPGGSRSPSPSSAGVSLAVKIEPSLITNQNVAKWLIALLLLVPYCLFRFAASFRTPSLTVRALAAAVTVGMVAFTFLLQYLPTGGSPPPPNFLAYRVFFGVAFGFLFAYVVVRLFMAGRGEPPIAATRMRLLGVAVAGLEVQVVVAALWLQGPTVRLVTLALTVVMGVLFLMALVLPSFLRVFLSRKEDEAFRRAIGELVSAGDSRDVAEHLLPHVCALVGASKAALLAGDGTVVARYPAWLDTTVGPTRGRVPARRPRRTTASACAPTAARRTSSPSTSVRTCRTSGATSCTSSTSWPAWSGSPSSVARWPSRWPSRPHTTVSPAWPTAPCSWTGWRRR